MHKAIGIGLAVYGGTLLGLEATEQIFGAQGSTQKNINYLSALDSTIGVLEYPYKFAQQVFSQVNADGSVSGIDYEAFGFNGRFLRDGFVLASGLFLIYGPIQESYEAWILLAILAGIVGIIWSMWTPAV